MLHIYLEDIIECLMSHQDSTKMSHQDSTENLDEYSFQAQLAQNETTEKRAPHVATTGSNPSQDKPAAFPRYDDMESAPGAKKSD